MFNIQYKSPKTHSEVTMTHTPDNTTHSEVS